MNSLLLLATNTPAIDAGESPLAEGLEITVVGVGIVFSALITIWILLIVLQLITDRQKAAPVAAPAAKLAPATPHEEPEIDPEVAAVVIAAAKVVAGDRLIHRTTDPELVAVITAAAMAAVNSPLRIKRITYVSPSQASTWAEYGRIKIHTSHRLRKKD